VTSLAPGSKQSKRAGVLQSWPFCDVQWTAEAFVVPYLPKTPVALTTQLLQVWSDAWPVQIVPVK
jgi:hypothetical protein